MWYILWLLQEGQGEVFISQTDTETIPKLCKVVHQRLYKLDPNVTFMQVKFSLEHTFMPSEP